MTEEKKLSIRKTNNVAKTESEAAAAFKSANREVTQQSLGIMSFASRFHEIDPEKNEPPAEWIEEYGEKKAFAAWRVARSAWLPQNAMPGAISVLQKMLSSMLKSEAIAGAGGRQPLQVVFKMPGADTPPPKFDIIDED